MTQDIDWAFAINLFGILAAIITLGVLMVTGKKTTPNQKQKLE